MRESCKKIFFGRAFVFVFVSRLARKSNEKITNAVFAFVFLRTVRIGLIVIICA